MKTQVVKQTLILPLAMMRVCFNNVDLIIYCKLKKID